MPESSEQFLAYLKDVEACKTRPVPIIAHCRLVAICYDSYWITYISAGIGRTGVFMMIELGIAHYQAKVSIDMPAILNKLRTQRMGLVQTEVGVVYSCQL